MQIIILPADGVCVCVCVCGGLAKTKSVVKCIMHTTEQHVRLYWERKLRTVRDVKNTGRSWSWIPAETMTRWFGFAATTLRLTPGGRCGRVAGSLRRCWGPFHSSSTSTWTSPSWSSERDVEHRHESEGVDKCHCRHSSACCHYICLVCLFHSLNKSPRVMNSLLDNGKTTAVGWNIDETWNFCYDIVQFSRHVVFDY